MGQYLITCVRKDRYDNIVSVGLSTGQSLDVPTIVYRINSNLDDYFTTDQYGHQARVYAKQHHITRNWFITTNPDGIPPNNLDNLRLCP
jgi:hypothetical protein